jgi:hypothetical protein
MMTQGNIPEVDRSFFSGADTTASWPPFLGRSHQSHAEGAEISNGMHDDCLLHTNPTVHMKAKGVFTLA